MKRYTQEIVACIACPLAAPFGNSFRCGKSMKRIPAKTYYACEISPSCPLPDAPEEDKEKEKT